MTNAELQLNRAEELLRSKTGTQVTYDQRLSEQLQAKAQLEDASAQLRDAEIQLSYTEIKSPIDGRIGRAAVSPGNIVGPDSGVLATVVSENPIRVLFSITQRELLDARRDTTSGDALVVRVRVIVEGEKVPTVVAVPQAAIAQDQSGSYLFVVNDKNVAEQRRVKTGVSRDGLVSITEGLKAGEKVIIQGQQRVRPGMTVTPTQAPPAASAKKQ